MNKLQQLREQYKNAANDKERAAIKELAEQYKTGKYQCYFEENGKRCDNWQEDCWCSPEHKTAWQNENYKDYRQRGQRQLTINEIQKRLAAMKPTRQLETSDL